MMEQFKRNLRQAFRVHYKHPGFTLIVVATLALGIGANTTMFSLVEAVILRPLPYANADQIVQVWERSPTDTQKDRPVSAPNFNDWRAQNSVFENMAALDLNDVNFSDGQSPERLGLSAVSGDFFPLMGVKPALGSVFAPNTEESGDQHVVLVSNALWKRKFGSSPGIIGQTLRLDGVSYTVLGVMPQGFAFPAGADLWSPLAFGASARPEERGAHGFWAIARLKPNVSLEQAQSEMNVIANRLADNYPATNAGWTTNLTPLRRQLLGESRLALLALFGAVGFVLLIACFNVGNLLFARAVSRRKEISIRNALGAGRKRLLQQFLTESLLLTCSAGIIGFLLAWWATKVAVLLLPTAVGGIGGDAIGVSTMGMIFTLGISVITGVIFGVAPALTSSQVKLTQAMQESARGMSEGRKLRGFRSFLTAGQVALSLVLLVGAGLLIKSFARLQNEKIGFQTSDVLTMKVSLASDRYKENPVRAATFEKLLDQVNTVPGVKSAAVINKLPLEAGTAGLNTFEIEGQSNTGLQRDMPVAFERPASGSYFETMGIPLVRGRTFNQRDSVDAPLVAIVDESAVQRYWPNEDAIGKHVYYTRRGKKLSLEIVGVVGSVKHNYLDTKMAPTIYRPVAQNPTANMLLLVRTGVEPRSLTEAIARAVRTVDPDLPVASVRTMDDIATETAWRLRFVMSLLSAFALMAVGLAALGVYGVLNYNVSQRMREMAIRMSLGAKPADVFRIVISKSLFLVLTGLAAGTAIALWLSRFLASFLYGVTALDLTIYLGVAVVMTGVGLMAALIPACRATKVDPGLVLRPE